MNPNRNRNHNRLFPQCGSGRHPAIPFHTLNLNCNRFFYLAAAVLSIVWFSNLGPVRAAEPSAVAGPHRKTRPRNGKEHRSVAVHDSAPIRPGDVISIRLKEDEDVKFEGEVGPAGLVQIPYLGKFAIAGKSEAQAEQALAAALEKDLYVKATLAVTVIKRAPGHVYIYGAVKQPGKVDLPPNREMTILQALAEVKGVSTWASPRDAYVLRKNAESDKRGKIMVDIAKAFRDIGGPADLKLEADDIILIPSATGSASVLSIEATEVIVTGEVKTPGLVLFAPGEQCSFVRAIFKAGNFTRFAKKSKVRFIRYKKGQKREVRIVNAGRIIDKGHLEDDFALQPGDMIIVDQKRFNF